MKFKFTPILIALLTSVRVFSNAQVTWGIETNVAASNYSNLHPRITVNASGEPLIIWGRMDDESVFFSRWNGSSFTTPIKLNLPWLTVATASWMGPDIASKGDTVYVVMKQTPEADMGSHIYIVSSFDGGLTFSSPLQVDNIADSISRFPAVTVDATGNPIVAFMKFDNLFMDSRWVVTRSSDYGNTFSTDVKASGWSGPGSLVCDCCPGSIICEGNNIAMLYRNNEDNIRDSWVGISTDGGSSFTDGWNVDQNNWNLFACPSTGPDGVIIGDSLYCVFMNGGNDNRVYRSTSTISSGAAQPSQLLTGTIMGLNSQDYPRIAKSGNAIAIVWKQNVNGEDQLPLFFSNNIVNSFPAVYDTVDLNDITNADLTLSDDNILVVWQDDNSGTVKYRAGTFTSATGIENANQQTTFSVSSSLTSDVLTVKRLPPPPLMLLVSNAFGQKIFSKKLANSENSITMNTSQWHNGIYFITLCSGKFSATQKINVQH